MRDWYSLREDLMRNRANLVLIDLDTALTLAQIATTAKAGSEKRKRNTRNARIAHDTVLRLRQNPLITVEEKAILERKISELRATLEKLGERFV